MSAPDPTPTAEPHAPPAPGGVRLHRFTLDEYHRIAERGVLPDGDPIEMLGGHLFIKLDHGPPYDVPLGIPPADIAGPDVPPYPQRRWTVREYRKLMAADVFDPALRTELVEGWVVDKMTRSSRHDSTIEYVADALHRRLGTAWRARQQLAVTLDDGDLEPDFAIVGGSPARFRHHHPRPTDVELAIEVSDSTLAYDRGSKRRDYARNGIVRYWIVNAIEGQIEVFGDPSGPTAAPEYRAAQIYRRGDVVPLLIRAQVMEPIPVDELFPAED